MVRKLRMISSGSFMQILLEISKHSSRTIKHTILRGLRRVQKTHNRAKTTYLSVLLVLKVSILERAIPQLRDAALAGKGAH